MFERIAIAAVLTASFVPPATFAALQPGDITIIGYRSDEVDSVVFVTWVNLSSTDEIFFTDAGFFSDGTLRDSEEVTKWTPPSSGVTAGTVVRITSSGTGSAIADIGSSSGNFGGLAGAGDQIFAGNSAFPDTGDTTKPGSSYSGTLLYGFDYNGSAGWDSDATNSNTSALPAALSGTYLNHSVAHVDNGQYIGTRSGKTVAEFKALIHDPSNWSFSDDGSTFAASLDSTDFTIIPEPGGACLAMLVLSALAVTRGSRRGAAPGA